MTSDQILEHAVNAGLFVWLAGAIAWMVALGVMRSRPLAIAPTRASSLSLPIVGAIIVAYFIVIQPAVVLVAIGTGMASKSDFGLTEDLRPAKVQTTQATRADQTSQPETLAAKTSQTATSQSVTSQATPAATATSAPTASAPAQSNQVVEGAAVSVAYFVTFVPLLMLLPQLFRDRYRGWGLHVKQIPAGLLKGLVAFLIVYPMLLFAGLGLERLYEVFDYQMSKHPALEAMDHSQGLGKMLIVSVAIIVAPLAEELFFRGILQTTLIQHAWGFLVPQIMGPAATPLDYRPSPLHRWGAIAITSVAFASLHPLDEAPIIFLLSLGLGYVYERTGILWASITLHVLFNAANVAVNYLNP
ncbi:MAG TPA: CPBP family intramembrane glutamic endopeptidase [Phycisphaerae bacterium]